METSYSILLTGSVYSALTDARTLASVTISIKFKLSIFGLQKVPFINKINYNYSALTFTVNNKLFSRMIQ